MAIAEQQDLVGTFEAHLILGVERSRLARWLKENGEGKHAIDEPVARLRSGPIWTREQIESKLRMLATEAGVKNGEMDRWAAKRSLARAQALNPPMAAAELEGIIRRPVRVRSR